MTGEPFAAPWSGVVAPTRRKVAWGAGQPAELAPAPRLVAAQDLPPAPAPAVAPHPAVAVPASAAEPEPNSRLPQQEDTMTHDPAQTLGNLFAGSGASAPSDPFGGLFSADPQGTGPEDVAPAPVEAPALAGFADIFAADTLPAAPFPPALGEDAGGEVYAHATEPAPAAELAAGPDTAAHPVHEQESVAADVPATASVSAPEPTPPALPLLVEGVAAGSPFPANPFGAAAASPAKEAPTTATPTRSGRVAAHRAVVEQARLEAGDAHAASPETLALANQTRYTHADVYEPLVTRLLGLGGSGDPAIQAFIRKIVLTRDRQVDRSQRLEYQELLQSHLAGSTIQIQTAEDLATVFDIAYDELIGIGPLGPLWRDDSITEIMVSGPDKVTIERHGRLEVTPVRFKNLGNLEETARRLGSASKDDRAISSTNPLVTMQLPGARVQFVWRPLAVSGVAITIRKFGALMGMDKLMALGALSEDVRAFLGDCVRARATLLISGGTSSGKTTFINALSELIPDTERVVTIEDALELQLRNTHVEAFVTKEAASADDRLLFGQDALLKASLRMRPDRIIVGEIRDAAGCSVMLEAANTGHAGTMTTIHADTPTLALTKMVKLLRRADPMPNEVAREEVATALDVIVQVVRVRGRRFVSSVAVVNRDEPGTTTEIFTADFPMGAQDPSFRQVAHPGADTALAQKMLEAGIDPSAWEV